MEHDDADPLGARRHTLITGARGQLGHALVDAFQGDDVLALGRDGWDVRLEAPALPWAPELVLHAAAWTDVDGAEDDPQSAAAVNVGGTAHAAALGAPLVTYSTDYVFDGTKREPYVESDAPAPLSAYGRTKLHAEAAAGERAWIVRSSWLFGETSHNFVRTMLRLGAERDEVAVVDDQRGCPTYVGHLAEADASARGRWIRLRDLAPCGGRRLHLGRVRGGDLRGRRARLPREPDLDHGVRREGAAARGVDPAKQKRRAAAAALARRPASPASPGCASSRSPTGRPTIRSWPRCIAQRWFQAKSGRRRGVRCRTSGFRTSTCHSSTARVPSATGVNVQIPSPTKSPSMCDTSLRGASASAQTSSHRRRYGSRPRVTSRARLPGAAGPGSPSPSRNASLHQSGYSRGRESRS